jgi:hypothetical protein
MPITLNGTTGIIGPDGSAGTPAIQGSDNNTGMFFPAADTIAFAEGGTEVMRIDSSGNVGIGTSSPAGYKLAVESNNSNLYLKQTTGDFGSIIGQRDDDGALTFSRRNGSTVTERARIASDGKFTLATETLYITNIPTTSTAGNCLISSGEGNKFYRSTSSLKYKRNVVDMQRGVQDVMQLRPVNFNGVSDFDGDKLFAGFIAEEVESLGFKEFVIYDDKGDPDGLQYANMVALLTKAIQEQQALITSLTARIAALEGAAQ